METVDRVYDYLPGVKIMARIENATRLNLRQYRNRVNTDIREMVQEEAKRAEMELRSELAPHRRTGRTYKAARAYLSPDSFAYQLGWERAYFMSLPDAKGRRPKHFYVYWFLYGNGSGWPGKDVLGPIVRKRNAAMRRRITLALKRK